MTRYRFRDDRSESARGFVYLALGALAGFAAGIALAERIGGLAGITDRVRTRVRSLERDVRHFAMGELGEEEDEDALELTPEEELEERVLEAFRNDPVLSERAIDIGALTADTIELSGWVHTADEADHAVTVTRGVPGVANVVNRMELRVEESQLDESAEAYENGEPGRSEGRWEGQQVGTGRRRQGTSDEFDRHADPRPELEDKWLGTDEALAAAAEDVELSAGNRPPTTRRGKRGDRTGGAPTAPTGVPKADHVREPIEEPPPERAD